MARPAALFKLQVCLPQLKLLPDLPKFENPQALSVWLYKVARNRCLLNRRGAKNARNRHVSLDELLPTAFELEELLKSTGPNPEMTVQACTAPACST